MLFVSYEFIFFFLAVCVIYYLTPKKFQWTVLLAGSYYFYFIANEGCLLYIVITTITAYVYAHKIEKSNRKLKQLFLNTVLPEEEKKRCRELVRKEKYFFLIVAILINVSILAFAKYSGFINFKISLIDCEQIDFFTIALPLGISFYTLQVIGYVIDVFRGTCKAEKNIFKFALFVVFFPQMVQGPINRYQNLAQTLFTGHGFDIRIISSGLQRILWGYFKKLVIADRILIAVNTIIEEPDVYSGAYVAVGMLFYAVQIYADFTGGIDIALGIAETFGIRMAENFRRPFFSKSVREYWRRWHISMGQWFADYVFYPFSTCRLMRRVSKAVRSRFGSRTARKVTVYLSSFIAWLATGIWHGVGWNFIVWGISNWMIITLSQELEPILKKGRWHSYQNSRLFKLFQVLRTICILSCLRMFDCYRSVSLTFHMFGTLFTTWNWHILTDGSLLQFGLSMADYIVLAIGICLLLAVSLLQRRGGVRKMIAAKPFYFRFAIWYILFLFVLLFGAYGPRYDAKQFIYNQF